MAEFVEVVDNVEEVRREKVLSICSWQSRLTEENGLQKGRGLLHSFGKRFESVRFLGIK